MVLPARHGRAARLLPRAGAVAALIAVWCVATQAGPTSDTSIVDLPVYEGYAHLIEHGLVPYRDFMLEYPPLSIVPFWLGDVAGTAHYALVFGGLMLVCAIATLLCTAPLADRRADTAAWLVALAPLATGALVRTHFDFLPAALTMAALLAFARERPRLGFALAALGTLAKLYPALLVPVALAWLLGRGERRAALQGIAVFALVVLAGAAPFLGPGLLHSLTFHLHRPAQIESSPASVLFALGHPTITGTPAHPDAFRSQGVRDALSPVVLAASTALVVAALALATWRARERPDPRWLVRCTFAAVLAFVALGKVLSPQYVIWLVPFAALAWAWGERALGLLVTAAIVLTQVEFPARYWDLVAGEPGMIALVAARNALLLMALVALLAGPVRSTRRAWARAPG